METDTVTRTLDRFGGAGASRSERRTDASMFLAGVAVSLMVVYDVLRKQRGGL